MQLEYKIRDYSSLMMFFASVSVARSLNIFWISIILFGTGYTFSSSLYSLAAVFQALQLLGIFGLFFSLASLVSLEKFNAYFRLLFLIYILWQLFFVFRGDFQNLKYEDVKSLIFNGNYGLLCIFVPLVALLPVSLINVKKLFDASFISAFFFLIFISILFQDLLHPDPYNAFAREALEVSVKFLAFPVGFALLTFDYHSNKRKLLAIATFILLVAFAIVRARRGLLLMSGMVIVFSFIFYFFKSPKNLGWVLASTYLLIIGYQFYSIDYSISKINFLGNLFERGLENTRDYVENCFFSSMSTLDWIIGKGYNVGYYCPGIDDSIFKNGMRAVIETDYLQLILTGGLVNLILLLLIVLPAAYLGFFHSSNLLSKKAATWILIWLFFLYPSNGYTFSIFHASMWIMVGLCYSKEFRKLSDQTIVKYFTKDINLNASGKA